MRADGSVARAQGAPPVDDAVAAAVDADEQRETFAASRLAMVRAYAETDGCRRRFLLSYFGEHAPERCGNCDVCERLDEQADDDLPLGAPRHEEAADPLPARLPRPPPRVGPGEVQRVDGDHLIVLFDDVGYKTLGAEIVAARHLLERL